MSRRNNDFDNLDDEWQEYVRKSDAPTGPRDWTPEPEVDEDFDPATLPQADPQSAPSNSFGAMSLFGLAIIALFFCLAGYMGIIDMPTVAWVVCGAGAFAAIAGAVVLQAPDRNDPDDDGARI